MIVLNVSGKSLQLSWGTVSKVAKRLRVPYMTAKSRLLVGEAKAVSAAVDIEEKLQRSLKKLSDKLPVS